MCSSDLACAVFASLGVWLWNDYHTYEGTLGDRGSKMDPDDELIVRRLSPLWPLEIKTGFPRALLKISGVDWDEFDVPSALTDWTPVAIRLTKPARDRYELATQLDQDKVVGSGASPDDARQLSIPVDALECPDIGYYWAADGKVFRFVIETLRFGNPKARSNAAVALGSLGADLPAERIGEVTTALLAALKDADSDVQESAASALGALAGRIGEVQSAVVVSSLAIAVAPKDDSSGPEGEAFRSAIRMVATRMQKAAPDSLIQDLIDHDSRKRILAVHALARRTLKPLQIRQLRDLRDDQQRRPWVRMSALDTLMEIEREKVAVARDEYEAEEKVKESSKPPSDGD